MKPFRLIILMTVVSSSIVYAQTVIPDSTHVSGSWIKANSPYIIEGMAIVDENETLNIEPGVEVRFNTATKFDALSGSLDATALIIYGVLEAIGTTGDSILFTRNGSEGYWGNIQIRTEHSATSTISHCIVEYAHEIIYSDVAGSTDNSYGGINIQPLTGSYQQFSRLSLESSNIRNNHRDGIYVKSSTPILSKSAIHHNSYYGINCCSNGNPSIEGNRIYSNEQDGIYIWAFSSPDIRSNEIYANRNGIEVVSGSSPLIENNTIRDNRESGFYCNIKDWYDLLLRSNRIQGNLQNIILYGGTLNAVNNLIEGAKEWSIVIGGSRTLNSVNQTIVNNQRGFMIWAGSKANLKSTICWNNGENDIDGKIELRNSLWESSDLDEGMAELGESILGVYPRFRDTTNGDFSIMEGSPAIDAGYIDTAGMQLPVFDLGVQHRLSNGRIDMGAFEYQQQSDFVKLVYPYDDPFIVSNLWDTIRWTASNPKDGTDILLSTDGGSSWELVEAGITSNEYPWFVPELISDSCQLLLRNSKDHSVADTSRYRFRISPNYIPGGKLVYGTWGKAYSPYKVFGPLEIPVDSSLIIEPGVVVLLKEETNPSSIYKNGGIIDAYGTIIADGTEEERILFSTMDDGTYWGSINAQAGYYQSDSRFNYCIFEFGGKGRAGEAEIYCGNQFSNNIVRNSYNNGLHVDRYKEEQPIFNCIFCANNGLGIDNSIHTNMPGKHFIATNCTFFDNQTAIRTNRYSTIINNSIFSNNEQVLDHGGGYGPSLIELNYSLFDRIIDTSLFKSNTEVNLNNDPRFVNPDTFDFHLRQNSPGIDAGNPGDDFSNEPAPNGGRINMGAYGNTSEATKSPVFRLSQYDIRAMGNDTLVLYSENLGHTIGAGGIVIGESAVEILLWTDDSVVFATPVIQPGTWDVHLTKSSGTIFSVAEFVDCHAPIVGAVNPFHGQTGGGQLISLSGNYFGSMEQRLLVDQVLCAVDKWTDTLIQFISLPHEEGSVDLILETEDLAFSDTLFGAFRYFYEAPEDLCASLPGTLKSGRNYILSCPVVVDQLSTLVIEPGVTIISNHTGEGSLPSLIIEGELICSGTESDPVRFTSIPEKPGAWKGLTIINEAHIEHTIVKYAMDGISCQSPNINIVKSQVSHCSGNGVTWDGNESNASGSIRECQISNNGGWGIACISSCFDFGAQASPEIISNMVKENSSGGIKLVAYGTAPYTGGSSRSAITAPLIKNNQVIDNHGYAIQAIAMGEYADAVIGSIRRYGRVMPTFTQNIISRNMGIIETDEWFECSTIEIEFFNSIFYMNGSGLYSYNGGAIFAKNTIIWEPEQGSADLNSIFKSSHCLGSQVLSGEGNINADPQFSDAGNLDFYLLPSSPCIDAGSNQFVEANLDFNGQVRIWDGNGDGDSIVDIGAIEFGPPCYELSEQVAICEGESYEGWTESGTYQRTLPSEKGCDSLITTELTVYPLSHITEDISICEGESYEGWTESGTYQRTYSSSWGCDSIITTELTVNPKPDRPSIIPEGNVLTSSATEGNQWFIDNEILPGATGSKYTPVQSGDYMVQVSIQGCTSDMSEVVSIEVTSIGLSENKQIRVYPNPTNGNIYISELPFDRSVNIELHDVNGKILLSKNSNQIRDYRLDISDLENGIYILVLDGRRISSIKLIKY